MSALPCKKLPFALGQNLGPLDSKEISDSVRTCFERLMTLGTVFRIVLLIRSFSKIFDFDENRQI